MRSRAERYWPEHALRALLFAALAMLLWRTWSPPASDHVTQASDSQLGGRLSAWTREPRPLRIALSLARVPAAAELDWLAALRRSGAAITWRGSPRPSAIAVAATAEPRPSFIVTALAPAGERVVVRDGLRPIAAERSDGGPVSARTAALAAPVELRTRGATAVTGVPATPATKRVAVFGAAGWETKFVIAALEESGWGVDPRIAVAPGVYVGGASSWALDTARHSAAVVLDGSAADIVARISAFAERGGGVVLAGDALRVRAFARLSPAARIRAVALRDSASITQDKLSGVAFTALEPGSAVLEYRDSIPVVAGIRRGAGRVIAVGYRDTWRWRMAGGERGPEEQRAWWSAVVGAAALARDTAAFSSSHHAAPVAALVAALGPRQEAAGYSGPTSPPTAPLYAVAIVALLLETVLRRRRGAR